MDQQKMGAFLKKLRNEKNLTQEQLAEKFGVSRRSVSRWEGGATIPDIEKCKRLADIYGVTIDSLITTTTVDEKEGIALIPAEIFEVKIEAAMQYALLRPEEPKESSEQ